MIRPLLDCKNYPHGLTTILKKFEEGKCLSCDELHFLASHEKALSSSTLDPVLRYYLRDHRLQPDKALPLEVPHQILSAPDFQQIKYNIHVLLKNNLSHVDLKMTNEQFLQFKAVGIHELVFWHGPHFIPGTYFYRGGIPYKLFFQWGRMFGVVKFELQSGNNIILGNVLIYLEDMHERKLQECIQDYTRRLREQQKPENTLIHALETGEPLIQHKLPSPMPGYISARTVGDKP